LHAARFGSEIGVYALKARRVHVAAALALGFIFLCSLLERHAELGGASDRALSRSTFGIALPVFACFFWHELCSGRRLEAPLSVLGQAGFNRRALALGVLGVSALFLTLTSLALGVATVLLTRSLSDPALGADLMATAWISGLAGFAYSGWFALGSTFARRGAGRVWFLALDWLAGATASFSYLPCPRGHLLHLLGAVSDMRLPLVTSAGMLLALGLACTLLVSWRCPP
jgi:hypothetical protein